MVISLHHGDPIPLRVGLSSRVVPSGDGMDYDVGMRLGGREEGVGPDVRGTENAKFERLLILSRHDGRILDLPNSFD